MYLYGICSYVWDFEHGIARREEEKNGEWEGKRQMTSESWT